MIEKLKTVFRNSEEYLLEECTIDSLMRLECDFISCEGCQYALCDIENDEVICEIELSDELCGIR